MIPRPTRKLSRKIVVHLTHALHHDLKKAALSKRITVSAFARAVLREACESVNGVVER